MGNKSLFGSGSSLSFKNSLMLYIRRYGVQILEMRFMQISEDKIYRNFLEWYKYSRSSWFHMSKLKLSIVESSI